ncbi:putative outer membrane starch-binding protein [Mucilaginibacter yixingensis]|uniref:Putative outer membrane starch-binding protein n=1 Tax=Mucilaginibacter yixingensis TaxID=1295612 RepID=A0A2T5J692_9SPHI|nr:RagB/SusD family nutrient uptake outer membrane protein [Mucilaginibacter yixingensis]PTQ93966.1 putative outer membrane starch-binding protein [Mucilaginibacter yixingensis]
MKRSLLFLAALLSLEMVSCKKNLDTVPSDTLTQTEYYNTEAKLNNALAGVYQPLVTESMYGSAMFSSIGAATDEGFYARSAQTTGVMVYNFDYTNADVNNLWTQLYQGIERANILIQNINLAPMDETKRKAILGETMFLRGYYYFLLVSNFGDVPLKTTPTASVSDVNIPRTPARDVYAQVLKDMQAAEGMVYTATSLGYGGRVSKTTVEGILARVCLTMAGYPLNDVSKYQDALSWAQKVVSSGEHSLNPSYKQMFVNLHQGIYDVKESMWEVEANNNNANGLGDYSRLGNVNGIALSANTDVIGYSYAFIDATAKLYNLYSAGDLRRDWAIAPYSYNSATTPVSDVFFTSAQLYNRNEGKFRREYETMPAPKNKNNTTINFPLLRYSDVLLMLAEAENQVNGPSATAYNAINQVRRRAFGLNVSTAGASVSVVSGLTLATAGNTGYAYSTTTQANVPLTITGGGGTGATGMASIASTGKVNGVAITNPGSGYTSAPTVKVGLVWAAGTNYTVGQQVTNGNNLYNVTTAGTSTATAPTNTSGASAAATTGAVFTYAGAAATVTATVATSTVDLPAGLSQSSFLQAIQDERARELCYESLRRADLIRWGIWVQTMNALGADMRTNGGSFAYGGLAGSNITARHNLYPIPSSEITVNRAVTQNPGW